MRGGEAGDGGVNSDNSNVGDGGEAGREAGVHSGDVEGEIGAVARGAAELDGGERRSHPPPQSLSISTDSPTEPRTTEPRIGRLS